MPELYQELLKLADSDMYPFHMPGHKRNLESTPMKGAFRCDITEIDGFDNLHDESGILLDAEERANRLYGAGKTFFLVNGSTCGVLSAVSAAVPENGTILASRGSHRSFYNAAYLRHLNIRYLPYKLNSRYGIPESYNAKDIQENLTEDIKAVFITSPTYEGKCSDIEGIARVCHKRGIPLIVDAAHGAHFGFKGNTNNKSVSSESYTHIPESAVRQGADIVIHSVHKTLPSMTQTALLHVQGELVDRERVKRFLRIYQSSSPSYVLMSSIDLCMKYMEENASEFVDRLLGYRNSIQAETAGCREITVLSKNVIDDAAKVVIYVNNATMTGQALYDILREEYFLQLEMAGDRYALAIISGWDTDNGISRLINAIIDINNRLRESYVIDDKTDAKICYDAESGNASIINSDDGKYENEVEIYRLPEAVMSINDAIDGEKVTIAFDEAKGCIAGEFVNLYPPGIPIIVPGERISREIMEDISGYLSKGMNVQGITDGKDFLCVKQR